MNIQLPDGRAIKYVSISGSSMIVVCGMLTYVIHIGAAGLTIYGTFEQALGRLLKHVVPVDDKYICACRNDIWSFHEFAPGLPLSHTMTVTNIGNEGAFGDDVTTGVIHVMGVGTSDNNRSSVVVYLYSNARENICALNICDNGYIIHHDGAGNVLYYDNAIGMPVMWKYGRDPVPIDVCSMLMRSSDIPADAPAVFSAHQHGPSIRYISVSGYRGAVEIGDTPRECRAVWPHRYVASTIGVDNSHNCIVYDPVEKKCFTNDANDDISDHYYSLVNPLIKNNGIVKSVSNMPGYVTVYDDNGMIHLVKVAR